VTEALVLMAAEVIDENTKSQVIAIQDKYYRLQFHFKGVSV
jgi:hypothetical protein